jgi:epoxyqueuosine reductase
MHADEFREVFRGSPVKRAKLPGLKRNAVIAMGNSGDLRFEPLLAELAGSEDPVLAETAAWAQEKLNRKQSLEVLPSEAADF